MGIFSDVLSGGLAANSRHKLSIPSTIFGGIDISANTLICGAPAGSISKESVHRLINSRFAHHFRRNDRTVYITGSIDRVYALYQQYGNNITVLGHNRRFDPFEFCMNYNDASFLLSAMIGDGAENASLRSWADITITLMEMSRSPMTYSSFDEINDLLFTSADADDFIAQVSDSMGIAVSSSLRASLFRLWRDLSFYQQFVNRLSRQIGYLRAPATHQNAHRQLVFYIPAVDSETVRSALFAGLLLYCRSSTGGFSIICDNTELGKEVIELAGSFHTPFLIYSPVLPSNEVYRNVLLTNTFSFLCFSGLGGDDINRILGYFSSQTQAWLPALNRFGFGVNKGTLPTLTADDFLRLRDGQAMSYNKSRRRCIKCANCIP